MKKLLTFAVLSAIRLTGFGFRAMQAALIVTTVLLFGPHLISSVFGDDLYVGSNSMVPSTNFTSATNNFDSGYVGFSASASNNILTVGGSNTVINISSDLNIGYQGSGNSMVISNRGRVADANGLIGYTNPASNNSVLVSGGLWTNSANLVVGGSGYGSITISGSGTVADSYGFIANLVGSTGSATVSGGLWTNSGALTVGYGGSGTMKISGGKVSSVGGLIGFLNVSTSSVVVSGGLWSNSSGLVVGYGGSGNLTISGGTVENATAQIGFTSGSTGSVLVSGGLWTNSDDLNVGNDGSGSLTISGGTVKNASSDIGYGNGTGAAVVSGGLWINAGNLSVSSGSLIISGGTVADTNGYIGDQVPLFSVVSGSVVVSGGLWTNSGELHVGEFSGSMTISGGTVADSYGFIGVSDISSGSVVVSGGLWTNSSLLAVGYGGSGSMTISGGTVADGVVLKTGSVATGVVARIGMFGGSTGSVVVSGGLWSNSLGIVVGDSGSGSLTISGNGKVITTGITIASAVGSTGALNIGALGGSDSSGSLIVTGTPPLIAFGRFIIVKGIAPVIAFGSGKGTINFNQTNLFTLPVAISGSGSVNQLGSGTTILYTSNSYAGGTTINQGTLALNNGHSLGSGNLSFTGSGVLADGITAKIGNAVAVSSGATATFQVPAQKSLTLSAPVTGNGALEKSGSGGLILASASNSFSGGTLITGGALTASSLGGGSLTISGTSLKNLAVFTDALGTGALSLSALTMEGFAKISLTNDLSSITSSGALLFNGADNFLSLSGVWKIGTYTLFSGSNISGAGLSGFDLTGSLIGNKEITLGTDLFYKGRYYDFTTNNLGTTLTLSISKTKPVVVPAIRMSFSTLAEDLSTGSSPQINASAVPEPSTYVLLCIGVLVMIATWRSKWA